MSDTLAGVTGFLTRGGMIRTRLREQAVGEVLDVVPTALPTLPGVAPAAVVEALLTLERRGVVRRVCERVHPYDSAEYWVTWGIAQARRPAS